MAGDLLSWATEPPGRVGRSDTSSPPQGVYGKEEGSEENAEQQLGPVPRERIKTKMTSNDEHGRRGLEREIPNVVELQANKLHTLTGYWVRIAWKDDPR